MSPTEGLSRDASDFAGTASRAAGAKRCEKSGVAPRVEAGAAGLRRLLRLLLGFVPSLHLLLLFLLPRRFLLLLLLRAHQTQLVSLQTKKS